MTTREGGVAGPRAWDPGSHPTAATAERSGPWPGKTRCLPGCQKLPRLRWVAAAGASRHARHLPQPACVYLAGLGPARFLFAAQWLSVQG